MQFAVFTLQSSAVITRSTQIWDIAYITAVTETGLGSQKTLHTLPSWASYGVSIVSTLGKSNHVMVVPH